VTRLVRLRLDFGRARDHNGEERHAAVIGPGATQQEYAA